jgi:hypothetical protein
MKALPVLVALLMALASLACDEAPEAVVTGRVVDSIFPIDEEIRRFQATVVDTPAALRGGAPDRDALVERFVAAVEATDTAALPDLVIDRAEFGFLYYPHTRFTAAPYELSPSLLWFQIQNQQSRGLTRLFRRMGGRPLGYRGYRCEDDARLEGPNRVWEACRLLLAGLDGDTVEVRLFGSIVARDGVFKFVSLSNEL